MKATEDMAGALEEIPGIVSSVSKSLSNLAPELVQAYR
jgi:hypothetical protein